VPEKRDYTNRFYKEDPNKKLAKIFGEKFTEYRNEWDKATTGEEIPDFPLSIAIDIIDDCNSKCTFCYRRNHENSKTRMDFYTYKKIIDEGWVYDLPSIGFGYGEPLMHPDIIDMVKYASNKEVLDIILTTNGTLLSQEMSISLIKAGLTKLHVSVDAFSKETYKKLRGGDLHVIEHNIRTFLEIRENHKTKLPLLRLSFVCLDENKHELDLFIEKWEEVVDYIDIQEHFPNTNIDNLLDIKVNDFYCTQPNREIDIKPNGDIQACCTFYSKHLKFGNINNGDTIYDIWKGKMEDLRNSFKTKKYYLVCKNCFGCKEKEVISV